LSAASGSRDVGQALVTALNSVTDCVTEQHLVARPQRLESGVAYGVAFGTGMSAPLRARSGASSGLRLDLHHSFVIAEAVPPNDSDRNAVTISYEYRLLDSQETELLVYHWHPGVIARGPDFPHIHVSASLSAQITATQVQRLPLDKRHVPTGLITLADVVRMLIAEFGVAGRHRDWPRLDRAELVVRRSLPERS
jgi:hypothetical protein